MLQKFWQAFLYTMLSEKEIDEEFLKHIVLLTVDIGDHDAVAFKECEEILMPRIMMKYLEQAILTKL